MPLSRLLVSQCSLSGHTTKQLPQVFFLHRGPPVEVGGSASASLLACCEVLSEPLWLPALGRQWAVLSVPLVMSRWYAGAAPNWSPRLGHGAPIAHRERAAAPECRVNVLHSCDHSGIAATTDSHECRAPWLEGVGGGWPPEVILKCDHLVLCARSHKALPVGELVISARGLDFIRAWNQFWHVQDAHQREELKLSTE